MKHYTHAVDLISCATTHSILAMPSILYACGFILGSLVIVAFACASALAIYCIAQVHCTLQSAHPDKILNYVRLAELVLGKIGIWLAIFTSSISYFLVSIVYAILAAESLQFIFEKSEIWYIFDDPHDALKVWLVIVFVTASPVCLFLRSVTQAARLSMFGGAATGKRSSLSATLNSYIA